MLRTDFRAALVALEDDLLLVGHETGAMVGHALRALEEASGALAEEVVARDDAVDERLQRIEGGIVELLTLQGPVAEDLRLLLAMHRVVGSVARIGDGSVNIARLGADLDGVGGAAPPLLAQVHELGVRAERAVAAGLDAFGRRRLRAVRVTEVEDQIDALRAGLTARLIEHAATGTAPAAWGVRMVLATRHLERIGDHATTIADEGRFVLTGARRPPRAQRRAGLD
jgi:phosphate transport system protein